MKLPDITEIHYLFELLVEMGPTSDTGMGSSPVNWSEIKAFSEITKTDLDSWECSVLKRLSNEYCYQFNLSLDPGLGPPWQAEEIDMVKVNDQVHDKLKSLPRSLFAKK